MGFGRFVCVALPFALAIGSLIAMLVAGLAGVADKSLYMFRANLTDLSISATSISSLINTRSVTGDFHDASQLTDGLTGAETADDGSKTSNITAADLGLYNLYDVGLWGYCYTTTTGNRSCTKAKFNWAANALNTSTSTLQTLATASGQNVTLPDEVTKAMDTFATVTKWTEVVFIIAYIALAVEILFGIFANCSRAISCVTFIIAGVATVAVCAAASMATAMSVVVVGTVESTAKWYGVKADFNTKFLAAVWIGAAFAIAAGFFWMFTICCCAPDHSSRKSRGLGSKRHLDNEAGEKLMPIGAYQPLHEPENTGYYGQQHGNHQYGAPRYPSGAGRSDLAYEPYSHRA